MNELESKNVQCPYCGEFFDVFVDCSSAQQNYIEDCQVCCQPILFDVSIASNTEINISISRENY